VSDFLNQASDWKTLAALTGGSFAYRLGRVGIMAAGEGWALRSGFLLRGISMAGAFSAEVGTFEGVQRLLSDSQNPNRWTWGGEGGWRQGLFSSAITFGMLKGAGFASREQNVFFRHLFQSSAMVAGHQAAGALELAPRLWKFSNNSFMPRR
jgi:hypothetical protein